MRKRVKNIFGEEIDSILEGEFNSKNILIFVHGFGTDKNEGFNLFLDISNYFQKDYLILRFDLTGYGESEGKDYEFQFEKAAKDLDSIIKYVKENYNDKDISIIAHSLGTVVTGILSPNNIKKIIFTGVTNSDSNLIADRIQKRIILNGGEINEDSITKYPRTSGAIQKIGKDFWRTLRSYDIVKSFTELSKKTDLILFKPMQDEIIEYKGFEEYKNIPSLKYIELNGDHNFTKPEDRLNLNKKLKEMLI